jgi:hypothetical protein
MVATQVLELLLMPMAVEVVEEQVRLLCLEQLVVDKALMTHLVVTEAEQAAVLLETHFCLLQAQVQMLGFLLVQ